MSARFLFANLLFFSAAPALLAQAGDTDIRDNQEKLTVGDLRGNRDVAVEIRFLSVSDALMNRIVGQVHSVESEKSEAELSASGRFLASFTDYEMRKVMSDVQGDQRSFVLSSAKLTPSKGEKPRFTVAHTCLTWENQSWWFESEIAAQASVTPDERSINLTLQLDWKEQPQGFASRAREIQRLVFQGTLTIPDGGSVIIGGEKVVRYVEKHRGPEFLSDMPGVGNLFRTSHTEVDRRMLLVTARILP